MRSTCASITPTTHLARVAEARRAGFGRSGVKGIHLGAASVSEKSRLTRKGAAARALILQVLPAPARRRKTVCWTHDARSLANGPAILQHLTHATRVEEAAGDAGGPITRRLDVSMQRALRALTCARPPAAAEEVARRAHGLAAVLAVGTPAPAAQGAWRAVGRGEREGLVCTIKAFAAGLGRGSNGIPAPGTSCL